MIDWKPLALEQVDKVFSEYAYGEIRATAKMPVIDQGDLDLLKVNLERASAVRTQIGTMIEGMTE